MKTIARISLLSLALATVGFVPEAAAQSPLFQWLSHMPMNGGVQRLDQNRDGRVDAILYDVNRDGRVDAVRLDSNFDGWLETVVLDTNYDGFFDEMFMDTDRNGSLEVAMILRTGMVGFDQQGYGYFSGWRSLASNTRDTRPGTMTIGGQGQGWSVEAHASPSTMTIGGGQNRGGTGNLEIDRLLSQHNRRMVDTWLGPYVVIR